MYNVLREAIPPTSEGALFATGDGWMSQDLWCDVLKDLKEPNKKQSIKELGGGCETLRVTKLSFPLLTISSPASLRQER